MTTAQVELPPKLIPVFDGEARVRGAYGGRGSAKTRSFAKMAAIRAYIWAKAGREGIILGCRQFMNSLDESSLEEIKAAIRSEDWLLPHFEIGEKYIRTICGKVAFKFAGLDRNIDSIKSKARILLCWVDEAEPVTELAWQKLIPTIREEGSELWVTWNPESENSPTHKRFRLTEDADTKIVEMNHRDNPWFPDVLERERLKDQKERPDSYEHIWEGDFVTVFEGAYFASHLTKAKEEKRIINLPIDPLFTIRLFADIGGTGANADNFVFWAAQFVEKSIHWVDHYTVRGQDIGYHLGWLRSRGYTPERAQIWLPHDGTKKDSVYDASYQGAFKRAGYSVEVIGNQGVGADMARVEQARILFPKMWFDKERCKNGLRSLGRYHEKIDKNTGVGLGPDHDGNSHDADAFGLGCITYQEPTTYDEYEPQNYGSGGWMR